MTESPDENARGVHGVRETIWTYLACTFALSSIFYFLIIRDGHIAAGRGLYVLGLMWCPGVSALLTCVIRRKPLASLGWKWNWRYQGLSYAIPIAYATAAYAVVWITGLGGVPNWKVVDGFAKFGGLSALSRPALLVVFVLITGTTGMIASTVSALGEEIGWRGLLVPELAKVTSFTKTALISGVIWTAWHVPILVFADYNNGTPIWYGLTCFAVLVISISFIFAWMRLRSGSLWTGAMLHATHNLVIQEILTPLTVDTGRTKYFIDEFGCVLAISAMVAAYLVWRRRGDLPGGQVVAGPTTAQPRLHRSSSALAPGARH